MVFQRTTLAFGLSVLAMVLSCKATSEDADFRNAIVEGIRSNCGPFDPDKGKDSKAGGRFIFGRAIGRDGYAEILFYGISDPDEIRRLEAAASEQLAKHHGRHLEIYFYDRIIYTEDGSNSYRSRNGKLIRKTVINSSHA